VLRGQEHLMNTPKHIALQRALGFATPRYAHLPVISNMDGSKMSKRDKEKALSKGLTPPEIEVHDFRVAGYLPEAIVNFIALLGWNPGDEQEYFTLDELTARFRIDRVGKAAARFDRAKLLAFNTTWAARLAEGTNDDRSRLLEAFCDFLNFNPDVPEAMRDMAGRSIDTGNTPEQLSCSRAGASGSEAVSKPGRSRGLKPAARNATTGNTLADVLRVCAGFHTFPDVVKKAGFLFVPDDAINYDPKAVKKVLEKNDGTGYAMLETLEPLLADLEPWTVESIENLIGEVCAERGCGMGQVAQPIRVAVSGKTISPGIGDTLVLLGKERTLARIKRVVKRR